MVVNLTKYELNIFIMKYIKKHYPLRLLTHALYSLAWPDLLKKGLAMREYVL